MIEGVGLFGFLRRKGKTPESAIALAKKEAPRFPIRINDAVSFDLGRVAYGLFDGTEINADDLLGEIDIVPKIVPGEDFKTYFLRIKPLVEEGLKKIAWLAKEDPEVMKIKVFGGYSNLAEHAKGYGFDIFEIRGDEERDHYYNKSLKYAKLGAKGKPFLEKIVGTRAEPKEILMSKETLIKRYYK
ncbi:hypothetical protein C4559_01720 [Candidatus Microgenomates bacterium]|nr:MAG: hypothetical protein C4559_01720 [Candidatus Microgenomates bacterium]